MRQVSPILRAMTYVLTFLFLVVAACISSSSQAAVTQWAPAVRTPLAANVLALGGANVADVNGAAAIAVNPAGLGYVSSNEAQATHLSPMANSSLDAIAIAVSKSTGGWGVAAQQLLSTGLVKTDQTGQVIGSFDYKESSFTLGGSQHYPVADVGVAVRGIWQQLDDDMKSGIELLAGLQRQLAPGWWVGVALSHVRQPQTDVVPLLSSVNMQVGASYNTTLFSSHASAENGRVATALAFRPLAGLELRAASDYTGGELSYRLGLGLSGKTVAIDYAFVGGGDSDLPQQLQLGHVVSLRFAF